jgi:hypothetical protein
MEKPLHKGISLEQKKEEGRNKKSFDSCLIDKPSLDHSFSGSSLSVVLEVLFPKIESACWFEGYTLYVLFSFIFVVMIFVYFLLIN